MGVVVVDRNIDVHIRALRKLGNHSDMIQTIRGVGYRFVESNPWLLTLCEFSIPMEGLGKHGLISGLELSYSDISGTKFKKILTNELRETCPNKRICWSQSCGAIGCSNIVTPDA